MGFMEFDKVRYWDVRDQPKYEVAAKPQDQCLLSDSRNRIDSSALFAGQVDLAQENKEKIEVLQRQDRIGRETAEKRRAKNGPKYKK